MADKTVNYQCPACTAPLKYTGEDRLECEYCGSSYTVAEIEAMFSAKNEAAVGEKHEAGEGREETASVWDEAMNDWGTDAARLRAYSCSSCGAELFCEETTAATICPYCSNPTVIPAKLTGTLKPEFIIPFRYQKKDAVEALKKHYQGKRLLPRVFAEENNIEKIQGVYVPFWLYDGSVDIEANYRAERRRTHRSGNYEVTTVSEFDLFRAGNVPFEKIPVDASQRMDDALMDSIEPYDYSELKPFSMAYLPGFVADKYDVSADECSSRADLRAANTAEAFLNTTVGGYTSVHQRRKWININRGRRHYALMPVWLLNTDWQGKKYTFAMNGQTGRFIGNLPVDKGLYWKYYLFSAAACAAAAGAVLTALMML